MSVLKKVAAGSYYLKIFSMHLHSDLCRIEFEQFDTRQEDIMCQDRIPLNSEMIIPKLQSLFLTKKPLRIHNLRY